MTTRLRGPALSKAVRDEIKQYIVDNNLSPGDMLPSEGQFAADLGVGRSSVREAVKALQSLGIVEVRHGNGLFVREWNFDPVQESIDYGFRFNTNTISELFQIRMWLEKAIIGDAVELIGEQEIAELQKIMSEWEQRVEQGETASDLDEQYHLTIYKVLNNRTLIKLLNVFWVAFDKVDDPRLVAEDSAAVLSTHLDLFEAIKDRDPFLARKRLLVTFEDLRLRLDLPVVNVDD